MAHVEEVLPSGLEAVLAAPSELVEANRGNGAEQPDSRDDREEEGHQRPVRRHYRRGNSDHRVDQPGEDQVPAHVLKIAETLPERPAQVVIRDLAYGNSGSRLGSGNRIGFGGHDTSPHISDARNGTEVLQLAEKFIGVQSLMRAKTIVSSRLYCGRANFPRAARSGAAEGGSPAFDPTTSISTGEALPIVSCRTAPSQLRPKQSIQYLPLSFWPIGRTKLSTPADRIPASSGAISATRSLPLASMRRSTVRSLPFCTREISRAPGALALGSGAAAV